MPCSTTCYGYQECISFTPLQLHLAPASQQHVLTHPLTPTPAPPAPPHSGVVQARPAPVRPPGPAGSSGLRGAHHPLLQPVPQPLQPTGPHTRGVRRWAGRGGEGLCVCNCFMEKGAVMSTGAGGVAAECGRLCTSGRVWGTCCDKTYVSTLPGCALGNTGWQTSLLLPAPK
jgi:hypothetical protein